jgi:pyruvate formate lyase activating enzyme
MKEEMHIFDRGNCTLCGLCVKVCAQKAFELAGYDIDPEELIRRIIRDRIFYEETGGGVTFTGGEPFVQISELREIVKQCKLENINVALETSMMAAWNDIEELIGSVDVWICDLKAMSAELHIKGTGMDNKIILQNICGLLENIPGKIWVRIPLIPDYNDTEDEFKKIALFLSKYEPVRVEIMPYHDFGISKYTALYQNPDKNIFPVPSAEYISYFKSILTQNNVKNVI